MGRRGAVPWVWCARSASAAERAYLEAMRTVPEAGQSGAGRWQASTGKREVTPWQTRREGAGEEDMMLRVDLDGSNAPIERRADGKGA